MTQPESDLMSPQRELDLRSLILMVWAMRVHLVVALFTVTVAYWLYWFVTKDEPPRPTYSRVVHFVFDGVDQGRYPNGSPFQIGDLVVPKLISSLYEAHELQDRGVSTDVFASAFSIEPYASDYRYIVERGEQLVNGAKSAELAVLQEQISAELRRAGTGAALLSFRPLSPVPLDEGDIGKLLLDLPKLWATGAIQDYGVLELDVPRYSPALFDGARIGTLEYLVALEMIRRNASLFLESIVALRRKPHGNLVRDPQTSAALIDVQQTVSDVLAQNVGQLSAHIVQRGVAKDLATLIAEYEHGVGQLEAASELAASRVADATSVLISLGGQARMREVANQDSVAQSALLWSADAESAAMGVLVGEMLAREDEAARLAMDLAAKRAVLTSLRESAGNQSNVDLEAVEARVALIVAVLRAQVEVVERIHSLLGKENFGYQGALYNIGGSGLVVTESPLLRPRDVYIYVLLIFGALTTVLVIGNAMSSRPSG